MNGPPIETLSRAIDEIYNFRAGAAHEIFQLHEAIALSTMPATSRRIIRGVIERLSLAARGLHDEAWDSVSTARKQGELIAAGAPPLLTIGSWQAEQTR